MDVTNKVTLCRERLVNTRTYVEAIEDLTEEARERVENKDYDGAKTTVAAKEALRAANDKEKLLREEKRQKEERKCLSMALNIIQKKVIHEWEGNIDGVNAECDAKIKNLKEQQQSQKRDLEESLSNWKRSVTATPKYSKGLFELLDCEKKLTAQGYYDEAKVVDRKIAKQKAKEESDFSSYVERTIAARRERLETTHAEELRGLIEKLIKVRLGAQNHKADALKKLQQSLLNHQVDMNHAHKLEYIVPTDCSNTVNANANRDTTSSTFRGSLLLERQAGKKTDVPSLCCLHEFDETNSTYI
eukprot:GFYU01008051.1.p1 GENE.GFYU01008051.1~~GFYU01008051.1.p1  ORF type:complete len:302 (-),score=100.97 GFYU01008051.1:55-960(-)